MSDKAYLVKEKPNVDPLFVLEDDFFSHVMVCGKSRSGKSTLMVNMLLRYIEEGNTVVWREVGKFDLLRRMQSIDDILAFLHEINAPKKRIKFWENYDRPIYVFKDSDDIEEGVINIFVFDLYCKSIAMVIKQYHELLKRIRWDRERNWSKKKDLVIVFDEANDIMPSSNKQKVKGVWNDIIQMVHWMRQWAGYHVRLVLSTHAEPQLHIDARNQCGLKLYKNLFRKDAYRVMQHEMYCVDNEEYQEVYEKLQKLRYMMSRVMYIDDNNQHGFLPVNFIPKKYSRESAYQLYQEANLGFIADYVEHNWETCSKIAEELFNDLFEEGSVYQDLEKGVFVYSKDTVRNELLSRYPDVFNHETIEKRILQAFSYHANQKSYDSSTADLLEEYKKERFKDIAFLVLKFAKKFKQREIADIFGVSQQQVSKQTNNLIKEVTEAIAIEE